MNAILNFIIKTNNCGKLDTQIGLQLIANCLELYPMENFC